MVSNRSFITDGMPARAIHAWRWVDPDRSLSHQVSRLRHSLLYEHWVVGRARSGRFSAQRGRPLVRIVK